MRIVEKGGSQKRGIPKYNLDLTLEPTNMKLRGRQWVLLQICNVVSLIKSVVWFPSSQEKGDSKRGDPKKGGS